MDNAMYKLLRILFIVVLVITTLNGCLEEQQDKDNVNILDTVSLTINDFDDEWEVVFSNHTTEPYVVEENLVLEGWTLLEKYEISFQHEEYALAQTLVKFETKNKSEEFMNVIKENYRIEFPEQSIESFGNESYFGINDTIYSDNISLKLLCFTINDIGVILLGNIPESDMIHYATIIESRIIDYNDS
jgi:hypothetical protein